MTESQTKVCQNCQGSFTIESDDFAFYEKISVPPPTWCPECRLLRKAVFRNDIFVYKRPDSATGKTIFSSLSKESPVKVTESSNWYSDSWDPLSYGRDYDFSRPFFEQFRDVLSEVLWPNLSIEGIVRSDWCNNVSYVKDCYLVFGSGYAENSFYSYGLANSKNVFNSLDLIDCEIAHEGFYNKKCYNSFFSSRCESSSDIIFCKDCVGCSNCFGCVGLRNKQYHVFNKPYSKEEYKKFLGNANNIGSFKNFLALKKQVEEFRLKFPVKFMSGRNNLNVSGDYITNSKNVIQSFYIQNGENLKYCNFLFWGKPKDSYDHFRFSNNSELVYDSLVCGTNISNIKFCYECYPECSYLSYCMQCRSSSNLFGCVGLRNKQYCILNKQYSKEEYEALIPRITEHINQMPYTDKQGRTYKYGEFFPPELSPFAYNETIAQEYFPLTKEEAIQKGYRWKDPEPRNYSITMSYDQIPDHVKDVPDSILNDVIGCAHAYPRQSAVQCNEQCTTAFKIIPQELQFYKRMNLPLPRLCPNCRHYERLAQRNPLRLWHRKCMCQGAQISAEQTQNNAEIQRSSASSPRKSALLYKNTANHFHGNKPCPNEFETSYAPDRPEIVYCEACYNVEVV